MMLKAKPKALKWIKLKQISNSKQKLPRKAPRSMKRPRRRPRPNPSEKPPQALKEQPRSRRVSRRSNFQSSQVSEIMKAKHLQVSLQSAILAREAIRSKDQAWPTFSNPSSRAQTILRRSVRPFPTRGVRLLLTDQSLCLRRVRRSSPAERAWQNLLKQWRKVSLISNWFRSAFKIRLNLALHARKSLKIRFYAFFNFIDSISELSSIWGINPFKFHYTWF